MYDPLKSSISLTLMDVQNQIKGQLKSNAKLFVSIGFEAALYCALYHHAKQGAKRLTRNRRYVPPKQQPHGQDLYGVGSAARKAPCIDVNLECHPEALGAGQLNMNGIHCISGGC